MGRQVQSKKIRMSILWALAFDQQGGKVKQIGAYVIIGLLILAVIWWAKCSANGCYAEDFFSESTVNEVIGAFKWLKGER